MPKCPSAKCSPLSWKLKVTSLLYFNFNKQKGPTSLHIYCISRCFSSSWLSAGSSVFHLPNARYCPVVLEFGLTQQQIHKQFVPSISTPWFCNFGCQFFAGASNLSQLTEDTVSLMALSTRKTAALSMFLKSSFGVSTDTSISFLYTASNASSRYDQVLEYAPET